MNESSCLNMVLIFISQNFIISTLDVLCNNQIFFLNYVNFFGVGELNWNEWEGNFFSISVYNDLFSITCKNIKVIKTLDRNFNICGKLSNQFLYLIFCYYSVDCCWDSCKEFSTWKIWIPGLRCVLWEQIRVFP